MTDSTNDVDNGLDDDRYLDDAGRARKVALKKAEDLRGFVTHLGVFLAVGLGFLFLNLVTSRDSWWFFYPLIPWAIGLAIHGWNVFNDRVFDDNWVQRHAETLLTKSHGHGSHNVHGPATPKPAARVDPQPAAAENDIPRQSEALIDGMLSAARQIPKPDVRAQVLGICAAADRVLLAFVENPGEAALARDFLQKYLTPANAIVRDYARLAVSNVPSAQATLRQVEANDFPQLAQKLDGIYDRLHRGRLIDLEVAREMLSLDVADWDDRDVLPAPERERAPRDL